MEATESLACTFVWISDSTADISAGQMNKLPNDRPPGIRVCQNEGGLCLRVERRLSGRVE